MNQKPSSLEAQRYARAGLSRVAESDDLPALVAAQLFGPSRLWEIVTGMEATAEEQESFRNTMLGGQTTEQTSSRRRRAAQLEQGLTRWRTRLNQSTPEEDLSKAARLGGGFLIPEDPAWPQALQDLGIRAPFGLWWRGPQPPPEHTQDWISVVGTRDPTPYGNHVTTTIATALAERGATIISGGAIGVDAMAHRAALEHGTGDPLTVTVMAGGIDQLYPASNRALLTHIADNCLVLSEVPPGCAPMRWRFLARNRLIAALSRAVIVTEGRHRSGSISTATHALELDRWVGAVPGPVTSATSAGPHRLLKEYPVSLIDSPETLCEELGLRLGTLPGLGLTSAKDVQGRAEPNAPKHLTDNLDQLEKRLIEALSPQKYRNLDQVMGIAGLAPLEAMPALTRLKRAGLAVEKNQLWKRGKPTDA